MNDMRPYIESVIKSKEALILSTEKDIKKARELGAKEQEWWYIGYKCALAHTILDLKEILHETLTIQQ